MLRFIVASVLALSAALCASAQTPIIEEPDYKPTLTFDVITVRQSPSPGPGFKVTVNSTRDSSRFEATNLPVRALMQIAYGYNAPFLNAPDWLNNTFFDIRARSDEAADARLAKLPYNEVRLEKRNAIRVLLAERFGLKTHMEDRNSSVFLLTVAKGGVKMKPVPPPPAAENGEAPRVIPVGDTVARPSRHGIEFEGINAPMIAIVSVISSMAEAPVIDKTGLAGAYNYTLQFAREWSAGDPDAFPEISAAIPEQLGLKLESVKQVVPNLIIDAMTKPSDN